MAERRFPKDGSTTELLVVEGPDDFNTAYHLLQAHGLLGRFTIEDGGGIDTVLRGLKVRLKANNEIVLGVVVDADEDVAARWQALRDILVGTGYRSVPASPSVDGTIVRESERTTVGIWLMPDNRVPGSLEDFVRFLVPQSDQLWTLVEESVRQIPKANRLFPAQHLQKAYIHTWLAWQKEPGKPIGQAITKKFLDAQAPYAQNFIRWLKQLFNL